MNPICCDKRATPYRRTMIHDRLAYIIGAGHELFPISFSVEEGFRCKICGRIRIPHGIEVSDDYERKCEALRVAGIEFDKELTTKSRSAMVAPQNKHK